MTGDILRVAVPSPLLRCFDYLLPRAKAKTKRNQKQSIAAGCRVKVPFGRVEQIGVVVEVLDESPLPRSKLRHALAIIDSEPLLDTELLSLLLWAQRYYHHPPGEVFASALPVLLRQGEAASEKATATPTWFITPAGQQALAEQQLARAPRQRASSVRQGRGAGRAPALAT